MEKKRFICGWGTASASHRQCWERQSRVAPAQRSCPDLTLGEPSTLKLIKHFLQEATRFSQERSGKTGQKSIARDNASTAVRALGGSHDAVGDSDRKLARGGRGRGGRLAAVPGSPLRRFGCGPPESVAIITGKPTSANPRPDSVVSPPVATARC